MNYIKVWAQQTDSDIFVFSETWLSIKDKKKCFSIKIIREKLSVSVVTSVSKPKCFEFLDEVLCPGKKKY